MTDPYVILGVKKDATESDIKTAFRKLAHGCHPDKHPDDPEAGKRFQQLNEAYDILVDAEKRAKFDATGSVKAVVLRVKKKEYTLGKTIMAGDVADIVSAGDAVFKIAREPKNNDLLQTEARVLKAIHADGTAVMREAKMLRYFPQLVDSTVLEIEGARRQTNILEYLEHYVNLEQVHVHLPTLRFEHAVWMFNRVLEGLDFIHRRHKLVHGAVIPTHIMPFANPRGVTKDPRSHGIKLIGWSYAVPHGEQIKAISGRWKYLYAPEVLAKKPATPETDIYMAAKSIMYLLGADEHDLMPSSVPGYLQSFLKSCAIPNPRARPSDAWALHEELKDHLAQHYGPKKYFHFEMPELS